MDAYGVLEEADIAPFSVVRGHVNRALGYVNSRIGNESLTMEAYERALKVWEANGDIVQMVESYLALAVSCYRYGLHLGDPQAQSEWIEKAKNHLQNAISVANDHQLQDLEIVETIEWIRKKIAEGPDTLRASS